MYSYLLKSSPLDDVEAIAKGYQLYAAEVTTLGVGSLLSITRAWRLVRFVDSGMLTTIRCTSLRRSLHRPRLRTRA